VLSSARVRRQRVSVSRCGAYTSPSHERRLAQYVAVAADLAAIGCVRRAHDVAAHHHDVAADHRALLQDQVAV